MIDLKNYAETNCGIAIDIGTSTVKAYLTKKENPLKNQNFSIEKNILMCYNRNILIYLGVDYGS